MDLGKKPILRTSKTTDLSKTMDFAGFENYRFCNAMDLKKLLISVKHGFKKIADFGKPQMDFKKLLISVNHGF